jgi:ABC-2 type transport system ATP-binding protein
VKVIEVNDLQKHYDEVEAVSGLGFEVREGEVFSLLGPNGAGKTTVIEILEGYRMRTGGHVRVLDEDPAQASRAFRERVGIVLQQTGVQPMLTVGEVLAMYGSYYPRRRQIAEVLELVELRESERVRVEKLSGGQRRRLDLALALVGDPDLLFLDEPTTGFDPEARRHAWATIAGLRELGKTIVLTTHYMDEAEALADRIAATRSGRIVATGAPRELGGRDEAPIEIEFALPPGLSAADLPELADAEVEPTAGGRITVRAPDGLVSVNRLSGWALERGIDLRGFSAVRPRLEDIYLQLIRDSEEEALS